MPHGRCGTLVWTENLNSHWLRCHCVQTFMFLTRRARDGLISKCCTVQCIIQGPYVQHDLHQTSVTYCLHRRLGQSGVQCHGETWGDRPSGIYWCHLCIPGQPVLGHLYQPETCATLTLQHVDILLFDTIDYCVFPLNMHSVQSHAHWGNKRAQVQMLISASVDNGLTMY